MITSVRNRTRWAVALVGMILIMINSWLSAEFSRPYNWILGSTLGVIILLLSLGLQELVISRAASGHITIGLKGVAKVGPPP